MALSSFSHDFPFNIMDIAGLINLKVRRPAGNSIYADCPFCNDKRGKLNLNFKKDTFRCNYCGESGGMLALYAKTYSISNSEAYREICDALQVGNFEKNTDSQDKLKSATKMTGELPSVENSEMASIQKIHQTLSFLLGMLTLSNLHRQKLRDRGLTDEQINQLGYKSTPPPYLCQSLTMRIIKQGLTVQGVPGFYIDKNGMWTVKFYKKTSGILIPIKGIDSLIRGIQIRLDIPIQDKEKPDKGGIKYLWLSSVNQNMGVTSGSPVHFVGDPSARTVYITEGALKADIAHFLMNRTFAAVAGANNLMQLDPLFAILANNGSRLIMEAHDMDKYRNKQIEKGASKIYGMAQKYKMECKRLTWNPNYKGVDDWQYALKAKKEAKENCLNFKEQFITDQCAFNDIAQFIETWHSSSLVDKSLQEYLGLTKYEYELYMQGNGLEEQLISQRTTQKFRIYQLDFSDESKTIPFAFCGIEKLYKAGFEQPPASEYRLVFDGKLMCNSSLSIEEILKLIFSRYNDDLPKEFYGHSVSPSDIIELYNSDERRYFWRDLTNFIQVKFSPFLTKPMKA